jgi:hypothetical protein
MTLSTVGNVIGFVGAIVILIGFGWGTLRNAAPDLAYHLSNLVGACFLAVSLTINFNLPALCLEVAWAAIALVGLVRMVRSGRLVRLNAGYKEMARDSDREKEAGEWIEGLGQDRPETVQ